MPETIACPQCQAKIKVPDAALGRKVRCPGCSAAFVAAVSPPEVVEEFVVEEAPIVTAPSRKRPPIPQPQYEPEPELEPEPIDDGPSPKGGRSGGDGADWQGVKAGLGTIMISHICFLVSLLLFLIIFLTAMAFASSAPTMGPRGAASSATAMLYVVGFLGLCLQLTLAATGVCAVVGGCLCLSGPGRHAVRGTATAVIVFSALVLLSASNAMGAMGMFMGGGGRGSGEPGEAIAGGQSLFLLLIYVVAYLTLVALLFRAIARSVSQRRAAESAMLLAVLTPPAILGALGFVMLLAMFVPPSMVLFIVYLLLIEGAFAGVLLFGLLIIPQVQYAVGRRKLTGD
jgi:predicted Zn finger-like uncharacterized protein